jgi:hypothetical protein
VCSYGESKNRLWYSTGDNCVFHMLEELDKLSKECIKHMKINSEMKKLTDKEENNSRRICTDNKRCRL